MRLTTGCKWKRTPLAISRKDTFCWCEHVRSWSQWWIRSLPALPLEDYRLEKKNQMDPTHLPKNERFHHFRQLCGCLGIKVLHAPGPYAGGGSHTSFHSNALLKSVGGKTIMCFICSLFLRRHILLSHSIKALYRTAKNVKDANTEHIFTIDFIGFQVLVHPEMYLFLLYCWFFPFKKVPIE